MSMPRILFQTSTSSADKELCAPLLYVPASSTAHPAVPHPHLGLSCVAVRASSSAFFDPRDERIVDVTYPSAQDAVHVPYSILGDDSVLLKFLNPHVTLITTISISAASTASAATTTESGGDANATTSGEDGTTEGDSSSTLFWTLVDTVTGKVIIRLHQESAALPVHAILLENHIVATYWNTKVCFFLQNIILR